MDPPALPALFLDCSGMPDRKRFANNEMPGFSGRAQVFNVIGLNSPPLRGRTRVRACPGVNINLFSFCCFNSTSVYQEYTCEDEYGG